MRWRQFGERLQAARKRAGLTQEMLAAHLSDHLGAEISQQSIQQWSGGRYRPADRQTLVGLCCVLYRARGLQSLEQTNDLLRTVDQGALYPNEIEQWFPQFAAAAEIGPLTAPQAGVAHPVATSGRIEIEEEEPIQEWFQRLIGASEPLLEMLRSPATYGGLGAVLLTTVLMGMGWQVLERQTLEASIVWVLCLWASTLILAWPQSRKEATEPVGYDLQWLRVSGTACGVSAVVGLLICLNALGLVFLGWTLPGWLIYLLCGIGSGLSYAAGLNAESWSLEQKDNSVARRQALEVTGAMIIAQALSAWLIQAFYPEWSGVLLFAVALLLLGTAHYQAMRQPT